MRKWPLMFGLALIAIILAAFHVFGKDSNDMLWGFAAGIGIGAVITWFVELGFARAERQRQLFDLRGKVEWTGNIDSLRRHG